MQTRPVIFVFSAVLLVPFIYSAFSIPGVCALPPDPNFGGSGCKTTNEPGKHIQTCCWTEQSKEPGLIKLREKVLPDMHDAFWWPDHLRSKRTSIHRNATRL